MTVQEVSTGIGPVDGFTGRVLIAVENAEHDRAAIAWAERYARFHRAPVVVVHGVAPGRPTLVVEPGAWTDPHKAEAASEQAAALVAANLRERGVTATAETVRGHVAGSIVGAAHPEDLVVAGTSGGGSLAHFLRGATVHHLLRHAPCPVAVVPASWKPDLGDARGRVVVGYDGTDLSCAALRWAAREARRVDAELLVVRVVTPGPSLRTDDDVRRKVAGLVGEGVRFDVTSVISSVDGPARSLLATAGRAELLVLGNHRASWLAALTGYSIPERAAEQPQCPVAVVPGGSTLDGAMLD